MGIYSLFLQKKLMKQKYILACLSLITFSFTFLSIAQTPTIGLRYFDTKVSDGYTLFTPEKNQSTYLINNCGEKINEWTFSERPGLTS